MRKQRTILLILISLFAVLASGCSTISGYFATETPTPTNTPLPTSTPTPRPTATLAPTVGDVIEEICPLAPFSDLPEDIQASETIPYVDAEAGYELAFSETWLLIDLVDGDVDEILADMTEQLPELQVTIETFLEQSGGTGLRMFLVIGDTDMVSGNIFPHMSMVYIADPLTTIFPIELLLEQTAFSMPTLVPGIEVFGKGLAENEQGISIGLICSRLELSGTSQATLQKMVVAKAPAGLLVFTFAAAESVYAEIEPLFDAVIHSFQVLEPESE